MKDRIRLIMEAEGMTPARFADALQIGRPVISHILNGRNNPSLEVITKILAEKPYINSDWLLFGKDEMYKDGYDSISVVNSEIKDEIIKPTDQEPDLFSQNIIYPTDSTTKNKYDKENKLTSIKNKEYTTDKETVKYIDKHDRKISRIIIYYSDNTYEIFNPEK